MKKFAALLMVVCMLCALTACGGGQGVTSSEPTLYPTHSGTTAPSQMTTPQGTSEAPTTESAREPVAFEEMTVVDNEACLIKITGIEPDGLFGYTLKVYLENRSDDTTYMMAVSNGAINGLQADPMFATEVAPGKKSNEEITFFEPFPEGVDIGAYTDIWLSFRVYDTNDWTAEPVATPSVHVYPQGQEQASAYRRTAQETDQVLVDNEYVTVTVTGYRQDEIWGYTADLFLVNKTDGPVMFSVEEASVNGYMTDPFYAQSVGAGLNAFGSISWSDTTLADNGITQVETMEFVLRAYQADDWSAEDYVNQTVTLTP